jgi:hypothetical protein
VSLTIYLSHGVRRNKIIKNKKKTKQNKKKIQKMR